MATTIDSPMQSRVVSDREFHPLQACLGGPLGPQKLGVAAEVILTHDHLDDKARGGELGLLIDRHVNPRTELPCDLPVGRDTPGEDVRRDGPYLSLAIQPPREDAEPIGGELYAPDAADPPHAREWDFLKEHAAKCLAEAGLSDSSTDMDKAAAFTDYAAVFKRSPTYGSFHPVDVILHSSYCTGAANVLFALANVSGIPVRSIAIANHSMIELLIDGRWHFADNHVDGQRFFPDADYVEITLNHDRYRLTEKQHEYLAQRLAWIRSPWHYSATTRWHWAWGEGAGRGIRTDVMDGYGVSVPCDPHHARALYPHRECYPTPVWDGPVEITLTEKASWLRVNLPLGPGEGLLKSFHVSDCSDNPVTAARVEWWFRGTVEPHDAVVVFGGKEIRAVGLTAGAEGVTKVRFDLPPDAVAEPGCHDVVLVSRADRSLAAVAYPTPLTVAEPISTQRDLCPAVTTLVSEPIIR